MSLTLDQIKQKKTLTLNEIRSKVMTPVDTSTPLQKFDSALNKTANVVNSILPGKQIGETLTSSISSLLALAKGDIDTFKREGESIDLKKTFGDAFQTMALPASFVVNPVGIGGTGLKAALTTAGKAGAQWGGLTAISSLGESMAKGEDLKTNLKKGAFGGAIGFGLGSTFNLGARALAKAAPSVLELTSGTPKQAIERGAQYPAASKKGINMSLDQIHDEATTQLSGLYKELGQDFEKGLGEIEKASGQTKKGMVYNTAGFLKNAASMRKSLVESSRAFAREFRLRTKTAPEGVIIDFAESPIVSSGEMNNVQRAFSTISTWDDFSARGMQDLAERVGALRNFESGAKTESSAIVGKMYNKIAGEQGLIGKYFPELNKLRSLYSADRTVLDGIQNVLNSTSEKPTNIQSAVSRLDTLFKENRETYLNVIKQLSERSGVDILSMLAGNEFQKVLPGFVRGIGGGGALAVGAQVLNPWLLMLAPLFSPRFVGFAARNAPAVAKPASQVARGALTNLIPKTQ